MCSKYTLSLHFVYSQVTTSGDVLTGKGDVGGKRNKKTATQIHRERDNEKVIDGADEKIIVCFSLYGFFFFFFFT